MVVPDESVSAPCCVVTPFDHGSAVRIGMPSKVTREAGRRDDAVALLRERFVASAFLSYPTRADQTAGPQPGNLSSAELEAGFARHRGSLTGEVLPAAPRMGRTGDVGLTHSGTHYVVRTDRQAIAVIAAYSAGGGHRRSPRNCGFLKRRTLMTRGLMKATRTGLLSFGVLALLCYGNGSTVCGADAADSGEKSPPTGTDITDHIDDELMLDRGVSSWKIDVSTSNGIVTLTGTIDNILAKERAARIAETVRGVRAVVNRVNVAPSLSRTDDEIKDDVDAAFVIDPATESWQIGESVQAGVVTLTGTVNSFAEKQLAAQIAKGVRGVVGLKNEIKIDYDTIRPDDELRDDVEAELKWDVLIDAALIDVKVEDATVTLTGTVGSAAEKRLAHLAAWVSGVKSVDDSGLEVASWARDEHRRKTRYVEKDTTEIVTAIEDALRRDPRVMSFNVGVTAEGSLVTLRGEVSNYSARKAAGQVASNTLGVMSVTNRLKVRPNVDLVDARLEEHIADALTRDPYVERFEVTVQVSDSVARLYGTVDSWFDKTQAETVAGNIEGIVDVRNYLTVGHVAPYTYNPYLDDYDYSELYRQEPIDQVPHSSDEQLAEDVRDELWWSPFVDIDQVDVAVNNMSVTLTGTVDSKAEKAAAAKNAYDAGAANVDNQLAVK